MLQTLLKCETRDPEQARKGRWLSGLLLSFIGLDALLILLTVLTPSPFLAADALLLVPRLPRAEEVRQAADSALRSVQRGQELVLRSREAVQRNRTPVEVVIERMAALEQLTAHINQFVNSSAGCRMKPTCWP